MAKLLKMPFVSGKDSLSSTYRYPDGKILKIPPVLLISVFGKIPDVAKTTTADFKKVGSTIVLVGKPDIKNFGGSTYFEVTKSTDKNIPQPDLKTLTSVFNSITNGIQSKQIMSIHDISEGGIATALAEMCFGGDCGAEIDLKKIASLRPDLTFFNETPGTFLVEVENQSVAKRLFNKIPHYIIGKTHQNKIINVNFGPKSLCSTSIEELKRFWQKPMEEIFHS